MIKVLLTENIHDEARVIFSNDPNIEVEVEKRSLSGVELSLRKWDVLGIRSKTQITPEIFGNYPRLAVTAFCTGVDNINFNACANNNCIVFHDRSGNANSVKEMVMTNIGILLRGILRKNAQMHEGVWDKNSEGCHEITGKILGIIGYGNIGSLVGLQAESQGMKVVYYDIDPNKKPKGQAQAWSRDQVLAKADVITIHVNGGDSNNGMCNSEFFHKMKTGSYFINASRGKICVTADLRVAIEKGQIGGAAIDVFEKEPDVTRDERYKNPLIKVPNVILTPHIGGNTEQAQKRIALGTASRLLAYLKYGWVEESPMLPGISFKPEIEHGISRVTFLHKNEAGQIRNAAEILTDYGINIIEQHSKAIGDFGYGYFDVNLLPKSLVDIITPQLKNLPGAIQVRIL